MRYTKGSTDSGLRIGSFDELSSIFQRSHDEIWEGGKRDPATAFDEFSKLLMAKIYDERFTAVGEEYKFQIRGHETSTRVAERIRKLSAKVKARNLGVFKTDIKLPDSIIFRIVKLLEPISLRHTDLDIKGRAFESFLGKVFRDEYGQYFTPRNVVKFMVEVLDPDEDDIVIDPACGSGGFLLYSLMHVIETLSRRYREDQDSLNRISWDFAHKQIFGIEINDRIARIAMMDMVIHDDGHSNIECNNALLDYAAFDKRRDIGPKRYSLVFTNPPFGAKVRERRILHAFDLAGARDSQRTEVLFIERCLDLLRDGGRLGIVLPDSILTNSSLQYVRDWVLYKAKLLAVVSLPQHAFVPSGAAVKSSLLFLEKAGQEPQDYEVFMATARHIGYDATGRQDADDLMDILEDWRAYASGKAGLRNAFLVGRHDLIGSFSPEHFVSYSDRKDRTSKALGELCRGAIFTGRTLPRTYYTAAGHKILKVRDLTGKGINWDNDERGFVSQAFFQQHQDIRLQENDILIITAAHHPKYIGQKVDIIDSIPDRYQSGVICSGELMVLRVDPGHIDPYYVYLFLKTPNGYRAIQSCVRGQTAHIYPRDVRNIRIPIPGKSHLDSIGGDLQGLRAILKRKTQANERYVRCLNKLLGLMQGGD